MVGSSKLYQPQWEMGQFFGHETSRDWNGNHYWGITGGYFQKLFTPKCQLIPIPFLFLFLFVTWLVPMRPMTAWQDDESNPHPSAVKKLWSGVTLRSPLSAVSDSFGHENEVDISKSSEDKTSATGSKVAPRSMGSLFSPMEKAKQAQREVYPLYHGSYTGGTKPFVQFTWE